MTDLLLLRMEHELDVCGVDEPFNRASAHYTSRAIPHLEEGWTFVFGRCGLEQACLERKAGSSSPQIIDHLTRSYAVTEGILLPLGCVALRLFRMCIRPYRKGRQEAVRHLLHLVVTNGSNKATYCCVRRLGRTWLAHPFNGLHDALSDSMFSVVS